ncbi:MAG: hypothetical protein HKN36_13525 [Hellea sp.]|nr:hypothetical protein [Hellea sp.]
MPDKKSAIASEPLVLSDREINVLDETVATFAKLDVSDASQMDQLEEVFRKNLEKAGLSVEKFEKISVYVVHCRSQHGLIKEVFGPATAAYVKAEHLKKHPAHQVDIMVLEEDQRD